MGQERFHPVAGRTERVRMAGGVLWRLLDDGRILASGLGRPVTHVFARVKVQPGRAPHLADEPKVALVELVAVVVREEGWVTLFALRAPVVRVAVRGRTSWTIYLRGGGDLRGRGGNWRCRGSGGSYRSHCGGRRGDWSCRCSGGSSWSHRCSCRSNRSHRGSCRSNRSRRSSCGSNRSRRSSGRSGSDRGGRWLGRWSFRIVRIKGALFEDGAPHQPGWAGHLAGRSIATDVVPIVPFRVRQLRRRNRIRHRTVRVRATVGHLTDGRHDRRAVGQVGRYTALENVTKPHAHGTLGDAGVAERVARKVRIATARVGEGFRWQDRITVYRAPQIEEAARLTDFIGQNNVAIIVQSWRGVRPGGRSGR
uniref:Uncharacterized protein n=1 Tax=Anopheles quadriannulatus TaxID=34691 RepID=A0A182XR76_ANOQN